MVTKDCLFMNMSEVFLDNITFELASSLQTIFYVYGNEVDQFAFYHV